MVGEAGNVGKTPQWKVEIRIRAPIDRVWNAVEDISLIPRYHPEVREVEYLSDTTRRAKGVSYRCVIPDGRTGWCVERVVEHIPREKTIIAFPEDSWGLNQLIDQFLTELSVEDVDDATTLVRIRAFYVPKTWKARVMNILRLRSRMRRRALQTLEGLRRLLEKPEE
ncbi:MAG: SRPBCC family protein [Methanomicrobiales archaeon]|nr:SRPBCC family protein [Methanomicrobiales archaeon]